MESVEVERLKFAAYVSQNLSRAIGLLDSPNGFEVLKGESVNNFNHLVQQEVKKVLEAQKMEEESTEYGTISVWKTFVAAVQAFVNFVSYYSPEAAGSFVAVGCLSICLLILCLPCLIRSCCNWVCCGPRYQPVSRDMV